MIVGLIERPVRGGLDSSGQIPVPEPTNHRTRDFPSPQVILYGRRGLYEPGDRGNANTASVNRGLAPVIHGPSGLLLSRDDALLQSVGARGCRLALPVGGSPVVLPWSGRCGQAGLGIAATVLKTATIAAAHGHVSGIFTRLLRPLWTSRAATWRKPVAQRFGLAKGQNCGCAGAGEHPGQGHEICGEHHRLQSSLIEIEFP